MTTDGEFYITYGDLTKQQQLLPEETLSSGLIKLNNLAKN